MSEMSDEEMNRLLCHFCGSCSGACQIDGEPCGVELKDMPSCPRLPFKFFVWEDVLSDYTSGLACAVARTTEEAIRTLEGAISEGISLGDYGADELRERAPKIYPVTEPHGAWVFGGG